MIINMLVPDHTQEGAARLRAVAGVLCAAPAVPVGDVEREVARREAVVHVMVLHRVQRRAR